MITKTDAYVVPFDELKRVIGSGDRNLLQVILKERASMLDEANSNRKDDDKRTCAKALTHLIDGEDCRSVPDSLGYLYGYAFEILCAHLGEYVGELDGDWTDDLDDVFAEHNVPLKFSDLVFGEDVIALPNFADPPEIGSWSPDELADVLGLLRAIDLDELSEEDEELAGAVVEVRRWVESVGQRPRWGLIGFSF